MTLKLSRKNVAFPLSLSCCNVISSCLYVKVKKNNTECGSTASIVECELPITVTSIIVYAALIYFQCRNSRGVGSVALPVSCQLPAADAHARTNLSLRCTVEMRGGGSCLSALPAVAANSSDVEKPGRDER